METSHFNRYFKIVYCQSLALVKDCQHVRYQAYCLEHKFLSPSLYPKEREEDEFDDRSKHVLVRHLRTNLPIATMRLVLANSDDQSQKFPIEYFDVLRRMKRDSQWKVPRNKIGEISRFSVSKSFRKRGDEQNLIHGITPDTLSSSSESRRHVPIITIGLFKALVEMSSKYGLTHWYALMEPALLRLLSRLGIKFTLVGPIVDYYGKRQPCMAPIEDVVRGVYSFDKELWKFASSEGQYYKLNNEVLN